MMVMRRIDEEEEKGRRRNEELMEDDDAKKSVHRVGDMGIMMLGVFSYLSTCLTQENLLLFCCSWIQGIPPPTHIMLKTWPNKTKTVKKKCYVLKKIIFNIYFYFYSEFLFIFKLFK